MKEPTLDELLERARFHAGNATAAARDFENMSRSTYRCMVAAKAIEAAMSQPKKSATSILVVSDLHCGHEVGLTPPSWQYLDSEGIYPHRDKIAKVQRACWQFFADHTKGRYDHLLVMGDAIDGHGAKSGGVEQMTTKMGEQAEIAIECLSTIKADNVAMVYGTDYHVAKSGDDFEGLIARELGATIEGHAYLPIDGVMFDLKHHLSASSIPSSRATPLCREAMLAREWERSGLVPRSDVILRGHVHYYQGAQGPGWQAYSMPALQGPGSRYGVRRCSGEVHFGLLEITIESGRVNVHEHIMPWEVLR